MPRADGHLVVGATVEEQGFDERVTAGAVHELLRRAYEAVPGITELELVEARASLRPGSRDNAPLLGPLGDGTILACGHFRNGILLAPATADAIAELLADGRVPPAIAPFTTGALRRPRSHWRSMQITLNGEVRTLAPDEASVRGLLELLDLRPDARGVAVALDGAVLPRGQWGETVLAEGQRVEILTAAQGG